MTIFKEKSGELNRTNPILIIIISIGHLFHDIYTSFLSPLLPLLIKKLEMTYSEAGFISVMIRLPSLMNPFIGAYADRLNLKYIVIISPAITAVSMCLVGLAPGYTAIVLLALATGISSSFFHVPSPVLIKQFAGKKIGIAMSSFQIGGEMARTVGPVLALGAVSLWSLEGIYRLIPLGVLMSCIFYWAFRKIPEKTNDQKDTISGSILETLKQDRILYISITGILLSKSLTASVLAAFLPTYLTSTGEGIWFSGGALSILQGSAVAGVLLSGTLSDRIGCRKMLIILTAATPFAMLFFLYSSGWVFIISLVVLGFASFSSAPVILALIQKRDFDYPSIANGIYMTISFMLSSSMILLAGSLSDIIGIESTFRLFTACSIVGIPFAFLLKENYTGTKDDSQRM